MFICRNILSPTEVKQIRKHLRSADWVQGQSALQNHKNNLELHYRDEVNSDEQERTNLAITRIAQKILQNPTVKHHCFLQQTTNPRFNKYTEKGHYSRHVDFFYQENVRTDWSMTLFLSDPTTYEGGELVIEDVGPTPLGYKLNAGDMLIYPSGKPHSVRPVTKGTRYAAILWGQSFIRDIEHRKILGKIVSSIAKLEQEKSKDRNLLVDLSYVYNNLMKAWGN